MRIVCVTSTFPTRARFWRGTFVQNFCIELEALGATVSAVVPQVYHAFVAERLRVIFLRGSLKPEKISTTLVPYPSLSILAVRNRLFYAINRRLCQKSLERQLDRIAPKPDLIYAHFIRTGLLVVDWCRRNDVRLAVIAGESSYDRFLRHERADKLYNRILHFDHLFFASTRNQRALSNYLGIQHSIGQVLGNAVNCEQFQPSSRAEAREQLGLPQDKLIAIFVGYFIDRKGPRRVLDAIRSLPDVRGVFIGAGPQRPRGDRVLHAGPVDNADLSTWLNAADLFVLPSYQEGRSNAVLEAMACGLPLVVSDRDFNREFLNETCALFIEPDSIEELARAIDLLARSPETRTAMGSASRQLATNFSQRARALRFVGTIHGSGAVDALARDQDRSANPDPGP